MIDLRLGDCLEVLRTMPDASVDAIVTDPPYGLSFMGKKWDYDVPSVDVWAECLRVLKPGGHLLAFAGTRTQHRMAVRIEDAGFEIRDMIAWCYGSGFPKSLDVSKAIDKAAGALAPEGKNFRADGGNGTASYRPTTDPRDYVPPAPATPEAQQWAGWGTALKPALEPITMARKPLEGTVAANVLAHGTGGINVDGCRVAHGEDCRMMAPSQANIDNPSEKHRQAGRREEVLELKPSGRWPANLITDGSDEVVGLFPQTTSGQLLPKHTIKGGPTHSMENPGRTRSPRNEMGGDTGSAARFFYCAKASRDDRSDGLNTLECIRVQITDQWGNEAHAVTLQVDTAQSPPRVTGGSTTEADREWSTVLFGSSTTGPFPMGCKSITETVTSSTTLLKTLSCSIRSSTSESIAVVKCKAKPSSSLAETAVSVNRWSLSFTSAKNVSLPGVGIVASQTQWKISDAGERSGNFHPTCKPTDLMRYLCRLVTPPGGIVLDPFMGSGSTGKAALLEGFQFIGIERDPAYLEIARSRIVADAKQLSFVA